MRFYMFDTAIIKSVRHLKLGIEHPEKWHQKPLFTEDYHATPPRLWEPRFDNGYPNIIFDPEIRQYRCYYTLFSVDTCSATTPLEKRGSIRYEPKSEREVSLAYAQSEDGVHWTKPALHIVDFNGSTDNNLILSGVHGASVLYDAKETDNTKRYKMLYRQDKGKRLLSVAFSNDGLHFDRHQVILSNTRQVMADTHNFVFRKADTGEYILITRHLKRNIRTVVRMTSFDFLTWSEPEEILCGQDLSDQIYSMPVFSFDRFYIGLPSIYHGGDMAKDNWDCVDCELAYSADTKHWLRIAPGVPFLPRGKGHYPTGEIDCGCIYAGAPIQEQDTLSFYYMGGNGQHTNFRETALLGATLLNNRLAYMAPHGNDWGILETTAIQCKVSPLIIDIQKDQFAAIQVQLLDAENVVLPGYEFERSYSLVEGKKLYIRWEKHNHMPSRKCIRIQFQFKGMKLYSFTCDATLENTFQYGLHPIETGGNNETLQWD